MEWQELFEKYGKRQEKKLVIKNLKKILILVLVLSIFFIILFYFSYPIFVEEKAIPIEGNTIYLEAFEGEKCEIYITAPNKEITFFGDYDCKEYSIDKEELLDIFNNQRGIYKIIVTSSDGKYLIRNYLVM